MDGGRTSMVSRAFLMTGLMILPGCATNGDLEALRTHMNNSLLQNRQQTQSRLNALDELKKKMEAQEKLLTAKQTQESRLDAIESAVKRALDQQLLLSEDVAAARMAVQDKDDRLLLLLDAQENLYQENLRALHGLRDKLTGKYSQIGQPRSQVQEPSDTVAPLPDSSIEKSDLIRPKVR